MFALIIAMSSSFLSGFSKREDKSLKDLHRGQRSYVRGAYVLRSYISMICKGRGGQTMAEGGKCPLPPKRNPGVKYFIFCLISAPVLILSCKLSRMIPHTVS